MYSEALGKCWLVKLDITLIDNYEVLSQALVTGTCYVLQMLNYHNIH